MTEQTHICTGVVEVTLSVRRLNVFNVILKIQQHKLLLIFVEICLVLSACVPVAIGFVNERLMYFVLVLSI